jgi:hypothetical protein
MRYASDYGFSVLEQPISEFIVLVLDRKIRNGIFYELVGWRKFVTLGDDSRDLCSVAHAAGLLHPPKREEWSLQFETKQ